MAFQIKDSFQRQQLSFYAEPSGIARQAPVCPDDPVAGNDDGDGIAANGAADSLGRHARDAGLLRNPLCNVPVGHCPAVGNGHQDAPDPLPEGRAAKIQRREKVRLAAVEIRVQPSGRKIQHGGICLLKGGGQGIPGKTLAVKPQAGQRCAVACERNVSQRRSIGTDIIQRNRLQGNYSSVFRAATISMVRFFRAIISPIARDTPKVIRMLTP